VKLLSAPWVVPVVAPPVREGAVLLDDDGRVVVVGTRADVMAHVPQGTDEDRGQGALLPGLVNAHTHLELSVLSGRVAGGQGLVAWATNVPREASALGEGQRQAAALRAARAARDSGAAAVGDVGNSLLAIDAIAQAGLQGIFFHEILGSREARTGDALADAAAERKSMTSASPWSDRLGYTLAPHAPYSASPELLSRIFAAAARTPHPTSIHLAEDPDELALLKDGTGRWAPILEAMGVPAGSRTPRLGPVAYLASLGAFTGPSPPLLVHMVHADAGDRALARRHGATVVLCGRSNLHIGGRLPDLHALLADGLALAIGTDSLASAPDLSLWGEVAVLAAHAPDLSPEIWLRAATAGGAAALGLEALGALAPGKRPGVLDVALGDLDAPLPSLVRTPNPRLRWMASA